MEIGRWIFMCYIGGNMARGLHKKLLNRVMNAPVNLYFDITPAGKLQTNFTKDIGRTDRAFFWHINWVFDSIADCGFKILLALYFSPFMAIPLSINIFFLKKLRDYVKGGKPECDRVMSKVRSKKTTHFTETYDGLTIIRAFGKQSEFTK